jgi:hypothetical protein
MPRGITATSPGHLEHPALGHEAQPSLLGHDQHLTVGVVEVVSVHRLGGHVDVRRHSPLQMGIAVGGDRAEPVRNVVGFVRERRRIPSQLADRRIRLPARGGADEWFEVSVKRQACRTDGSDAIHPGAAVAVVGHRERGARQLLGVQAERRLLRIVLSRPGRAPATASEANSLPNPD